jgi:phosphate transport system permease protein
MQPTPRHIGTPTPRRSGTPTPRRVSPRTPDDVLTLVATALSSLALVTVFYEHVFDGSGTLGFLVCWYLGFLALYGGALSMGHDRPTVVDGLVTATLWVAASVVVFAVGSTVIFTFVKGWSALVHTNFYTQTMNGVSPTAPLDHGGIWHAIAGTAIQIGIAIVVSVPLGIGTAVYLSEVGGPGSRLVRTVVEAMTALPEILSGLFIYVTLIVGLGVQKSGIAVSAAMAVTMVPIIARSSEVSLRVVPAGLREASFALAGSRWRTVRKVVLPTARAGLATAMILGVARGIGETAIPLLDSGSTSYFNKNPFANYMSSLPLYIFDAIKTGQPVMVTRGFGAGAVLLIEVGVLFALTRLFTRTKATR